MIGAVDLEDHGVAREAHLDEHVLLRELGAETFAVGAGEDIDAVADALGVSDLDRLADVEREVLRVARGQGVFRQLARVERHVERANPGVALVQEVEHRHLEGVIAEGDRCVLRSDEVQPDDARITHRELEGCDERGEHLLGSAGARDLEEVPDGDAAARRRRRRPALEGGVLLRLRPIEVRGALHEHVVPLGVRLDPLVGCGEVGLREGAGPGLLADLRRVPRADPEHQLEIELVLRCGAGRDVRDHRSAVLAHGQSELAERREEVVVAGLLRGGDEPLHRPRLDDRAVERIRGGGGERDAVLVRASRRRDERVRAAVHAEPVFEGPCEVGLRIDRAREMAMKIAALRHRAEEGVERGRRAPERLQALGGAPFRRDAVSRGDGEAALGGGLLGDGARGRHGGAGEENADGRGKGHARYSQVPHAPQRATATCAMRGAMHELARIYLFVFGVLTIAGGVMGFVKANSRPSLVAGGLSGLLLLVAGYLVGDKPQVGLILGLVVSLALAARFVMTYRKSKKLMPAGLMAVLGIVGVAVTVLALTGR